VVVDVRDVHYAIDKRPILSGIDLRVRRGLITAIMGPSGTGKTTLLKLITAQVTADRGQVVVLGRDVAQLKGSEIYALRKRMGMLFQNGALLTDMDVFENVAFPVREHTDLPDPLIRKLVFIKLQAVGLRGAVGLMPGELSGGMARRVALARAIVMDPEILIYDEPFAGLDPISLGVILRLIKQMKDVRGMALSGGTTSIKLPLWPDGSHGDLVAAFVLSLWRFGGEKAKQEPPKPGTPEWEEAQRAKRRTELLAHNRRASGRRI